MDCIQLEIMIPYRIEFEIGATPYCSIFSHWVIRANAICTGTAKKAPVLIRFRAGPCHLAL